MCVGAVAGVECLIARTGYTGENGYELFCRPCDAERLAEALLAAGQAHGWSWPGSARGTAYATARRPTCLSRKDEFNVFVLQAFFNTDAKARNDFANDVFVFIIRPFQVLQLSSLLTSD